MTTGHKPGMRRLAATLLATAASAFAMGSAHAAYPDKPVRLIVPRSVVTRQSTDVLAVEDAEVAAALRFIRERACDGIRVADVLKHVPVSRSILERRFKDAIGRSPHSEIRAVQVRAAAKLLEDTDLPLKRIAAQCGIPHMEYLSYLFGRAFGMPPGAYRKAHGARMSGEVPDAKRVPDRKRSLRKRS